MVYCSVACWSNGNHNLKDLRYFTFPSDKRLGTWIKFCRRAGKKFAEEAAKAKPGKANNLRICSAHFPPEAYRKTLNGRRETHDTALPTLFRPKHDCTPREARYEKSGKRRRLESNDENNACLANQLPLAATDSEDLTHVDYSYVDYCNVDHDHPYCLSPENDKNRQTHTETRLIYGWCAKKQWFSEVLHGNSFTGMLQFNVRPTQTASWKAQILGQKQG